MYFMNGVKIKFGIEKRKLVNCQRDQKKYIFVDFYSVDILGLSLKYQSDGIECRVEKRFLVLFYYDFKVVDRSKISIIIGRYEF